MARYSSQGSMDTPGIGGTVNSVVPGGREILATAKSGVGGS